MSWRSKKRLDGLSFQELSRQIKQGRIDPLYLFVGEEIYLHERALRLLNRTIDESARQLNIAIFSLGESGTSRSPAGAMIDTANQLPMMAARRIVVARELDKIKEDDSEIIVRYLAKPSETTTLVFQAATIDQRRKITEALLDKCTVVVFDSPGDRELAKWASDYVKESGGSIQPQALERLVSLTGNGMMRLTNELDKLATYAGGEPITLQAVDQLVHRAREHSSFELWDVIISRDRKRAMQLIHRLLDDGAEPVMLVGALAGLLRRMLTVKEMIDRGSPPQEVAKAAGQYGARATAFTNRVSKISGEELRRRIVRVADVDRALKSSEATPRLQLEYLIAELSS